MTKFEKDRLCSLVKCCVIDNLINEILEEGEKEYNDLDYLKKTALCKLMQKKSNLYGRVIA
tara:strand:- start:5191 stop:5373 length:183 start_codon:yes stop_codon:yes gene_type:complete